MSVYVDTEHKSPRRRSYTFRTWAGDTRRLDGVSRIEFAPEHVVFTNSGGLVEAVPNRHINDLKEVQEP